MSINSHKIKIGTDPEFFLRDVVNHQYVSAHNIVPGDKKNPHRLPDGSHVQADGTAVEFNIEPALSGKEFGDKVESALNELRKIIPDRFRFTFKPCITFNETVWKSIPAASKELGCDPDYRIVKGVPALNKVYDPGRMRTGSGHIHIGWTKDEETNIDSPHGRNCTTLIEILDDFYNPVKHLYDPSYYNRAQFYGGPKSFRVKPYGVEYRTPSNFWLRHPKLTVWLADAFLEHVNCAMDGTDPTMHVGKIKNIRSLMYGRATF